MSPKDLYLAVTYQNKGEIEKITHKILSKGCRSKKLTYTDEHGLNCLHKAALIGDYQILEKILACNLDPNKPDVTGHTSLHYAAYAGNPSSVHLLIQRFNDHFHEKKRSENIKVTALLMSNNREKAK